MFKHIQKAVRFRRTFSQSDHLIYYSLHQYFIIKLNFFSRSVWGRSLLLLLSFLHEIYFLSYKWSHHPLLRRKKKSPSRNPWFFTLDNNPVMKVLGLKCVGFAHCWSRLVLVLGLVFTCRPRLALCAWIHWNFLEAYI